MMFNAVKMSMMVGAMVLVNSAYATNIAVADSQVAVMSTSIAKSTVESLNASLKPQRDRMQALVKDIESLKGRVEKDAKVLSADDLKKIQTEYQAKVNEYNSTADGVQKRVEDAQNNMLKSLLPKMEGVIDQIRKESNIDIIIEKKNAIWASPEADITKKITDRINAAK